MNRPEPIELENNLGPDAVTGEINRVPWMAYDVDEMDLYIAEKDAEIARLESMRKVHVEAIASMEDRLHQDEKKIRRLRRALWIARADRAIMTLDYFTLKCKWFKDYMKVEPPGCDVKMVHKWANIERKCRAKAEGYK